MSYKRQPLHPLSGNHACPTRWAKKSPKGVVSCAFSDGPHLHHLIRTGSVPFALCKEDIKGTFNICCLFLWIPHDGHLWMVKNHPLLEFQTFPLPRCPPWYATRSARHAPDWWKWYGKSHIRATNFLSLFILNEWIFNLSFVVLETRRHNLNGIYRAVPECTSGVESMV